MTPHDPTDGRVAQYVVHDALRVAFTQWLTSRGLKAVPFEDDPDCPTYVVSPADLVLTPTAPCDGCGHSLLGHSPHCDHTTGHQTLACSVASCTCAILTCCGR